MVVSGNSYTGLLWHIPVQLYVSTVSLMNPGEWELYESHNHLLVWRISIWVSKYVFAGPAFQSEQLIHVNNWMYNRFWQLWLGCSFETCLKPIPEFIVYLKQGIVVFQPQTSRTWRTFSCSIKYYVFCPIACKQMDLTRRMLTSQVFLQLSAELLPCQSDRNDAAWENQEVPISTITIA